MTDGPGGAGRPTVLRGDCRGLSPVVGKLFELAIAVLFVAALSSALFGGVVSEHRAAVADELADRSLAAVAAALEDVPPNGTLVYRERFVDLPDRIGGHAYRIRAVDRTVLVLEHPHPRVGGRVRLALPSPVLGVSGELTGDGTVRFSGDRRGLRIRLLDATDASEEPS